LDQTEKIAFFVFGQI